MADDQDKKRYCPEGNWAWKHSESAVTIQTYCIHTVHTGCPPTDGVPTVNSQTINQLINCAPTHHGRAAGKAASSLTTWSRHKLYIVRAFILLFER